MLDTNKACRENYSHNCVGDSDSVEVTRFYTIKQIQVLLGGKSRSTIYRWISKGFFPEPIKVYGSSLWPQEQIKAWRNRVVSGN